MATHSGDDTKKPTALAKIHLEDGTTLVGKSFGSHEGAEGEVSSIICVPAFLARSIDGGSTIQLVDAYSTI
jgi:hypothetical protein